MCARRSLQDTHYANSAAIPSLKTVASTQFKNEVYERLKKQISTAAIALITRYRGGEAEDLSLARKAVEIFVVMGDGVMDEYDKSFQAPLLEATREYYTREASDALAMEDVPTYLKRMESVLLRETELCHSCLQAHSEEKLLGAILNVMLIKHQASVRVAVPTQRSCASRQAWCVRTHVQHLLFACALVRADHQLGGERHD